MCPDRQILSVYLDGELPSPWKEKLETHLASCFGCRKIIESWKQVSGSLREPEDPGLKERVWEGLNSRVSLAETAERIIYREKAANLWRRSVTLPFPAVVLGAAAAAALVFFFVSLWLRPPAPAPDSAPNSAMARLPLEASELEITNISPLNDISGVLQYLGSTDSNDIVIIHLPESRNFQSAGEPKIIRAADYSQRRAQQ
jgi:hypothetical protein